MELIERELALNTVCRICFECEAKMDDIFEAESDLKNKLEMCAGIQLIENEELPRLICECCKSKLIIAFHFQKQCLKSDQTLREMVPHIFVTTVPSPLPEDPPLLEPTSLAKDESHTIPFDLIVEPDEKPSLAESRFRIEFHTAERRVTKKLIYFKNCKICGKEFQNLKQHMLIHTQEKKFKCNYCKKEFSQRGNFQYHLNIHTNTKPFKCKFEGCDKAFCDPNSLKSHRINHTKERNYKCDICGLSFGYSQTLKNHRRTHTNERIYACSMCSKKFTTSHGLKRHVRTHTNERPYPCTDCSKSFGSASNLQTHRLTHTGIRKFKCDLCTNEFAYKSVLKRHIERHAVHAQERIFKKIKAKGKMKTKSNEVECYEIVFVGDPVDSLKSKDE